MKKLLLALFVAMPLVAGKQKLPENSPSKQTLSPQTLKEKRARARENKQNRKKHDENIRGMRDIPRILFADEIKRQQKRNAINNN